ncbi:hypothetical protein L6164_010934 [Bauhinia variegata]|uniref:Uncharacterized protein n=1 Tax=Bauhinia variegata TaxID=167791 RepID=A0ACB9P487_BAUVA|nr:hypothetical protein L6164_010934 [Bauhinia variegata]
MVPLHEKLKVFMSHRWLVFVCAMWVQSFAGIAYMFGSISPIIKSTMGYNQKQIAMLGLAKDLGDNIGFVAGKISEFSPTWCVYLVGVVHNFVGYGLVWLIVTHRFPSLPLWAVCIFIFVGTNCTPYYNTASLVACVQSFPENRGPVVGILKGFVGLSGAILTQIVAMMNTHDQASLILVIALGPATVAACLMFIIRPVQGFKQARASDSSSFTFIYSICLLLAAYLMGVLLVENIMVLDPNIVKLLAVILFILVLLPAIIPILLVFHLEPKRTDGETLLLEPPLQETTVDETQIENEKPPRLQVLPVSEGPKEIVQFHARFFQSVAQAVKKIKRKNGPRIGEDFTLTQAMAKIEFWLIFFSLVLGAGTGLTIINNMGQICQSLGDSNANVYVSMLSISNFLGRVGGGYFSEVVVRNFAYPRLFALAVIQAIMAIGFSYYAIGLVGQLHVVTILTGLGYGAHWSIGIASASELFGLKNFGSLYNFLTMACPVGSLFLSGFVASTIYDYYAEQQAKHRIQISHTEVLLCEGKICYSFTCGILAGVSVVATVLSFTVVRRTKKFYAQRYANSLS